MKNKTEINFILLEDRRPHTTELNIKFLIFLHLFFYFQNPQHKRKIEIGYTYKPLYLSFKKSWCKFIAKIFYPTLFIAPCILAIRLGLSFSNKLWWWICLVLLAPWFIVSLIYLIRDLTCKIKIQTHIASIKLGQHIKMDFGNPGAGKTSSTVYECVILAELMWNQICHEYKLLEPELDMIQFKPQLQKERDQEIIDVYKFYTIDNPDLFPCLYTTIPVNVDGKWTGRLKDSHIIQEERLPYGTIGFIDESRIIIPPELHRTNPDSILNMAKFSRQFGNFHFRLTDQAKEGAFNAWRRCTSENTFLEGQKTILECKPLVKLVERLSESKKQLSINRMNLARTLQKISNCIGYRKYTYCSFGSEYKPSVSKSKTFILPRFLNADYDDRSCRKAYACLDKPLKRSSWQSFEMTTSEINEIFSSSKIKELSKSKKEKKNQKQSEEKQIA